MPAVIGTGIEAGIGAGGGTAGTGVSGVGAGSGPGTGAPAVASTPSMSDLGLASPTSDDPEARIQALEAEVAALKTTVAGLEQTIASGDLRAQIEKALADNQALDMETATLLVEAAMSGPGAPDAATAVRELRKRKPFLFNAAVSRGSAMSGAVSSGDAGITRAAEEARASGDRAALLRYLKMRRSN